jgi:hypothetical protein
MRHQALAKARAPIQRSGAIKSCDVTFQLLEFPDHVEFHLIGQNGATMLIHWTKATRIRLKRWEAELADFSSAFIGRSLEEWVNRTDEVILF